MHGMTFEIVSNAAINLKYKIVIGLIVFNNGKKSIYILINCPSVKLCHYLPDVTKCSSVVKDSS